MASEWIRCGTVLLTLALAAVRAYADEDTTYTFSNTSTFVTYPDPDPMSVVVMGNGNDSELLRFAVDRKNRQLILLAPTDWECRHTSDERELEDRNDGDGEGEE